MTREENQNNILRELYEGELVCGILEMARIGFFPLGDSKGIEVYVHTDDPGKIPHFHLRKKGSGRGGYEFDICVKFESAEYFTHGKHKGTIPTKMCKELNNMLKSVDKSDGYRRTYWEIALDEWNRNNSDMKLDIEEYKDKQPDYSKLNK